MSHARTIFELGIARLERDGILPLKPGGSLAPSLPPKPILTPLGPR